MAFHDRLLQLMQLMEKDLDERGLYANRTKTRPFVDWSPELVGDTPEARRGTQMEFYEAFQQGYLLALRDGRYAAMFRSSGKSRANESRCPAISARQANGFLW